MSITATRIGVAYFPVPKIACTSLKKLFYYIENETEFRDSVRNGATFHIHNFYQTLDFEWSKNAKADKCWRIAVVRDPIERLLSAYSNRVIHHKELSSAYISDANSRNGVAYDPDLETFIERFDIYREHSHSIRHHTNPMINFLGTEKGYFNSIFNLKSLNSLVQELEVKTGRSLVLPHEQRGGPKIKKESLSSNAIEKLKYFYRHDYDSYASVI